METSFEMARRIFGFTLLGLVVLFPGIGVGAQGVPQGDRVSLNGIEMYYETVGAGEPLLMVHGWSGTASYFEPLLERLSADYRLIIPELRGHGRSTNPTGVFLTAEAAEDLAMLLDHLGLSQVRALGASAGGLTLMHLALNRPDAISKMILVGVGNRFPPACQESMLAADADSYAPEWWEVMRKRHPGGDVQIRELPGYLRQLASAEDDVNFTSAALRSVQAQTFLVQGDQDWCFPPVLAAEMHQAIPESTLWVIPEGEHVPILGPRAAAFLDSALDFFRDQGMDQGRYP